MTTVDDVLDEVLEQEAAAEEEAAIQEAPADEGDLEELSDPDPREHVDAPLEDADDPLGEVEARAVPPGLVVVRELDGVPLFYERISPPRAQGFQVKQQFVPVLVRIVRQVKSRAPESFGPLERISSAGMYVGKSGMHGLGRACDIDRMTFADVDIAPIERHHAATSLAERQRYWALGAICRANACFVLHGRYDAAHADHFHVDNTRGTEWNTMTSTVALSQAVANDIFGKHLVIDGEYGAKTRTALAEAGETLKLGGHPTTAAHWGPFLLLSARLGFRLSVA
jgi:hypothetical protein